MGGNTHNSVENTRNPLVDLKSAAANLSNILLHIVQEGRSEYRNKKATGLVADTDAILEQLESLELDLLETVEVGGLVLQVHAEYEPGGIVVYEVYHHGSEIHTAISEDFKSEIEQALETQRMEAVA